MIRRPAPSRLVALAAAALLGGCVATPQREETSGPVQIVNAAVELPEHQLLDVGIAVFDPGAVEAQDAEAARVEGEIRRAEARYMAVHLKKTMQRTGHWGAVRVIPVPTDGIEVLVVGEIDRSSGEELLVRIDAYDAGGRQWFSRFYKTELEPAAYRHNTRGEHDAFQDLYNHIANDLAAYKADLGPAQLREIRELAELRFAGDLAPLAFRDYLAKTADGLYFVRRLPARDDPMLARVQRVREREQLLIDTLNGHYDAFYDDMWGPYEHWRNYSYQEAEAQREIERQARNRKILGAVAIAGAIASGFLGGSNTAGLTTTLATTGAMAVKSGMDVGEEAKIHEAAVQELGDSFEAEVTPMRIEVEGEVVELTGTSRAQYARWRDLLHEIFRRETGLNPTADPAQAPAPAPES